MFGSFSRDDTTIYSRSHASYRMNNQRHNPYVGTFHGMNRNDFKNKTSNVVDTKSPLLPMFRHAPPSKILNVGLKSLLFDINENGLLKPILTQVQVSQQTRQEKKRLTTDVLRNLPLSIYDVASSPNSINDDDMPVCSICLECFKDGDELRTLECSHCYHRGCIDVWLIGCLSDEVTDTCNCPQCRQSIGTNLISTSCDIPSAVFLKVGESLSQLDSLSDLTSESSSHDNDGESIQGSIDRDGEIIPNTLSGDLDGLEDIIGDIVQVEDVDDIQPLCESEYSDCGFPLIK